MGIRRNIIRVSKIKTPKVKIPRIRGQKVRLRKGVNSMENCSTGNLNNYSEMLVLTPEMLEEFLEKTKDKSARNRMMERAKRLQRKKIIR